LVALLTLAAGRARAIAGDRVPFGGSNHHEDDLGSDRVR